MAHSFALKILHITDKLERVGFSKEQAYAHAEILADIIDDRLVTKHDLVELKKDIELKITETKKDLLLRIKDLQLNMSESKSDLIKWMLGVCTAQAAIIISCMKFMH